MLGDQADHADHCRSHWLCNTRATRLAQDEDDGDGKVVSLMAMRGVPVAWLEGLPDGLNSSES